MKFFVLLVSCTFFVCYVFGKDIQNIREGRWFRHTYTETVVQKEVVTSLVPSSCVHVEPTLPPCRSVRNLEPLPEFVDRQIYSEHVKGRQLVQQQNPVILGQNQPQVVLMPVNSSKSVGWAEYLGLVAPTVTVTAIQLQTTTVLDPKTVVTFSVKGCKPSKLPLNLDRCPTNGQYGISVEEILPTSIISNKIVPSARSSNLNDDAFNTNDLNGINMKNVKIEPSTAILDDSILSSLPTEKLSNVELNK